MSANETPREETAAAPQPAAAAPTASLQTWIETFGVSTVEQFLRDYLDVDGVLRTDSAKVLYQKLVLAASGHDPEDLLGACEKTFVRLARIEAPDDLTEAEVREVAEAARQRADRLFRRLRLENLPPYALFLTLAGLFGYMPELLRNPLAGEPEV